MVEDQENRRYDEWITGVIATLESDAVSFCQIVGSAKYDFGLRGGPVEQFVRHAIIEVVRAGGVPAIGGERQEWVAAEGYGTSPDEVARVAILKWQTSGRDPDLGDIWFVLPKWLGAL